MAVTLLNTFTLSNGDQAGFEAAFETVSQHMRQQPGFIHHRLVHSIDDPDVYVNVATWTTVEAHENTIKDENFFAHLMALAPFAHPEPKLYETTLEVGDPAVLGS